MIIFTILLIVVLLAVVGHRRQLRAERAFSVRDDAPEGQIVPPSGTEGSLNYEYTITSGKDTRKYLAHVPAGYDNGKAVPLVLFFHGGGGWAEQAARDYGWIEKSDKEGFIVVFPNGSGRMPRGILATWNTGVCCGYARDNNIDDVRFTKDVINDISAKFNIDKEQIFATGMSNGGMMAHQLACTMADTFRAVASVTGTDPDIVCQPSRPISVLHIHAKNDDHVLFDGGMGENAFQDEEKAGDFISVPETISRWITRDRLNDVPTRVLDVPGAYCDLYTSSVNSAQLKLCVTETGGHSWPGGSEVRGKVPSRAIIANDVIWDFFKIQK